MEKRRSPQSRWGLDFFGLPRNHSANLHSQIFDMVHYGNGFTVMELYKMPTHLRNFYYSKLADAKEKEAEQVKKANSQGNSPKTPKVRINR